jgi:hypothetical protein
MMKRKWIAVLISWSLVSFNVMAQTSGLVGAVPSEHLMTPDILKNKKFEADERITDLQLKALSGSLSRYSTQFSFGYSGPRIDQLNEDQQPNPDHRSGDHRTNFLGSMGIRYRITPDDALNFSTGVRAFLSPKGGDENDINDPSLGYDRTYLIGKVQSRSSLHATMQTSSYYRNRGQIGSAGVSQNFKWSVPGSQVILGAELSASHFFFNRDYNAKTDGPLSTYFLAAYPSLEYRLSKSVNFNTSWSIPYGNLRKFNQFDKLDRQLLSQRAGIGWGITREIYFNPYINFFPEKMQWKNASLAFNTIFSIF